MPVNSDIRQAVILALQAEGADVPGLIADNLRRLAQDMEVLIQSTVDGNTTFEQASATFRNLEGRTTALREALHDVTFQPNVAGMEKIDVALNSLIVTGLKFQDTIETAAGKATAAFEKTVVPINALVTSGLKLQDTLHKAFAATVVPLDSLVQSGLKFQGVLQSIEQTRLDATRKAFEDAIIPLNSLIQSGLRLQETNRAAAEQGQAAAVKAVMDEEKRARAVEAGADAIIAANQRTIEANAQRRAREEADAQKAAEAAAREAERKAAANDQFIQQANAALQKQDAEQAKLDAQAKARLDARAAREKQVLDQIAAAATKAEADRAAADARQAEADARKDAANRKALADLEGWGAMQASLRDMDRRRDAEAQEAMERTAAGRQQGTRAIGDFVAREREAAEAVARERQALEELQAVLARNAAQREREAAATAFVTKNTTELAAAMQEMHRVEREASTFNFMSEPGRNVVGKTTEEIVALQSQIASFNRTTAVASGGLVGFVQQFNPFNRAAAEAAKKTTDLSHADDNLNRSTRQASYGLLAFSYAVQDFQQSGLSAVMNNIPMMVMGIGGSAGLAGATMIAAAAFEAAAPHLTQFGRYLNLLRDPLRDAANDIAGLKDQVQALEDKPFKVAADYTALRQMREELEKTEKAVAEWEALKNKRTKVEEESKQIIEEGVVEGGGKKNVEEAILEIKKKDKNYGAASLYHGQIAAEESWAKYYEDQVAKARKAGGIFGETFETFYLVAAKDSRAKIAKMQDDMDRQARDKIAKTVSSASTSEAARKELEDYYMQNRAIFEAHGVTAKFGEGIVLGSRANVEAERQRAKSDKDQADAAKKAKKEADDKAKAREATIDAAVADTRGGSDDLLEKRLQNAIEGRKTPQGREIPGTAATPEEAVARERAPLIEGLKGRGVAEDVAGEVADRLLHKAREAVLNNIAEARKPKLDVKLESDLNKAADKVDQAFVDKAAAYFTGQALAAAQGAPMARNRQEERKYQATGQPYYLPPAEQTRRVEATIGRDLGATAQDVRLAPIIRQRAGAMAQQKATEAMARTPLPDPSAMVGMVGGANAQAMAAQAQATAALLDVLQTLNAKLDQATAANRRNAVNARHLNNQAQGGAMKKGSLTPVQNSGVN